MAERLPRLRKKRATIRTAVTRHLGDLNALIDIGASAWSDEQISRVLSMTAQIKKTCGTR